MSYQSPSIATHVPVTEAIPAEDNELAVGRDDIPPPSLWQQSVKVSHKVTKQPAIVARVDWSMGMFRAYYPDQRNPKTGEMGRYSDRTEWEHCRDWNVEVTFSPAELERQAARERLDAEIRLLDATEMAAVMVLVDETDPAKGLAKLQALRKLGVIKAAPEVAQAAVDEAKAAKGSKK